MFNRNSRLRTFSHLLTQIERMIAVILQPFYLFQCATMEMFPVFLIRLCPGHFCQSQQTRINHILHMLGSRYILRPNICLHTLYIICSLFRQNFRNRIIKIYFLQSQVSADRFGLSRRSILVRIQITKSARCHDHVMPCFGCFNSAFFTTP